MESEPETDTTGLPPDRRDDDVIDDHPVDESAEDSHNLPSNRRMRVATALMGVALLALVASAALFLLPVSNPGVQDCGSPVSFLLRAKSNAPLVESDGTAINGWKQPRLQQAYDDRCSVQVGRRAVPAGGLLIGFWLVGLVAIIIGWTGRRALRKSTVADMWV